MKNSMFKECLENTRIKFKEYLAEETIKLLKDIKKKEQTENNKNRLIVLKEIKNLSDLKSSQNLKVSRGMEDNEIIKTLQKLKNIQTIKENIMHLLLHNVNEDNHFKNNKIYLDMTLYIELSKNKYFKKNALLVHNLIKKLMNKSIISKSSYNYPKNNVLFTTNPLNTPFVNLDLVKYDKVIYLRDELIESLEEFDFKDINLEKEIKLFIFLKLFLIQKIPNSYFEYLTRDNILYLKDQVVLIVKEINKNDLDETEDYKNLENIFIPLHTIIFDKFASKILNRIFPKNISNLFDNTSYIFSNEYEYYDKELIRYLKKHELDIKTIRGSIKFEYELNNTPLTMSLKTQFRYPKISLLEIEKLYPESVKKELLDIERNNIRIYKGNNEKFDLDDDNDDELEIQAFLKINYELYEEFRNIIKVPNSKIYYKSKQKIKSVSSEAMNNTLAKYLKNWYSFIQLNKDKSFELVPIFLYVEKLLAKVDRKYKANNNQSNENNQPLYKSIKYSTLQKYLNVLFHYCFDILVKSVDKKEALKKIDFKLKNSNLNPKVQIEYQKIIVKFLNEELNLDLDRIKSTINCSRSIIFEDELDLIVDTLIKKDKKNYKSYILTHKRAVFVILAYYTGLRKNELISRTLRDFLYIKRKGVDNKFYINVDKKGVDKINKEEGKEIVSLKNRNAIRSFEFEITNAKHLEIVKNYYYRLMSENITFLFPRTSFSESVSRNSVIKFGDMDKINEILQNITNRYTVIHSFRHTYVTNELNKIINSKNKKIEDIFDLTVRIGHGMVETTLSHYAHLDFFSLFE
ncbi:hypothetical protein [Aliarcobacter cryaerophilus]|uniref:hypothetical protein n=1 Tax=Aliarcobacter cryaerophilus TaxID=28198 RepID=UPI003DA550C8